MAKIKKKKSKSRLILPDSGGECNHDFHFVNLSENLLDFRIARFVCEKCGIIKKVRCKEEY